MSTHRYVDSKFWDDDYVSELDPIEKLLFLYLLTNPLTNVAGIYEIQTKRIAFDTGIDREMVDKIIERFAQNNKLIRAGKYIVLLNWGKNQSANPSVAAGVARELEKLPNKLREEILASTYSLPKYWDKKEAAGLRNEQAHTSLVPGSHQTGTLYPTLPYPTLLRPYPTLRDAGEGEGEFKKNGEEEKTEEEAGLWLRSPDNVLGLTENDLRAIDRPEYEDIDVLEEYQHLCREAQEGKVKVNQPVRFLTARIKKHFLTKKISMRS